MITNSDGTASFLDDLLSRVREADGDDTEALCTHDESYVLSPPRGDFSDDHETVDVMCRHCKGLFVATIWKIDRPTEYTPMRASDRARYAPMTTSQAGSAWSNVA